jgi:dienelactone hydrolase
MGTKTLMDQPEARGKQMMAALKQAISLGASGAYAGKIDASRQAVMGHSMGGGGTLAAARDNPSLKAAIPLAPWHTTGNWSAVKVPTFIVACQKDVIAPVASHAFKFHNSLSASTPHAFMELSGANHFCVTNVASEAEKETQGRLAEAWLKYYVNGDTSVSSTIDVASPGSNVNRYMVIGR